MNEIMRLLNVDPLLLQALRGVVHENWTVAQALEVVGE